MPPEPVPWERAKDCTSKDQRKHERGASSDAPGSGSSSSSRWRDSYHGSRDFPRASPCSASPRRQLPGHYRQGGDCQPVYPEDSGDGGHGCFLSRSDRFYMDDESFRFSSSRYGGGRSNGSTRGSRGSFKRSPFWGSGDLSRHLPYDALNETATAQRSVAVPISSASQTLLKDQNDKAGGSCNSALITGHRFSNREHSLSSTSWKPSLKWSRSGSLTSSKTARSETEDAGLEAVLPLGGETPIRSPVMSPLPIDEDPTKKKPRLGWGQGLAKYEKQKVEQSTDASASGSKGALSDNSPKIISLSGCLSPATPCSATCSSSPGTEDKPFMKSGDADFDKINKHDLAEGSVDEVLIRLDQLEVSSISNLTSLLADLLQTEDACSGDSTFARHSTLNKLMILKEDISKELEKTESDIDMFETELKYLDFTLKSGYYGSSFFSSELCMHQLRVPHDSVHEDPNISLLSEATAVMELAVCDKLREKSCGEYGPGNSSEFCQSSTLREVSHSDLNSLGDCTLNFEAERLISVEGEPITISDGGKENQMNPAVVITDDSGYKDDSTADENLNAIALRMTDSNLTSLIMETNKGIARKASTVFDTLLQTDPPHADIWGLVELSSCRKNDSKVTEKLCARKRRVRFKEQALTLKFIALHQLWKEDQRLLSLRRNQPRWSKHFEFKCRFLQNGSKKKRSSVRTRSALPGNKSLVPNTEIVNFTSKLLQNSQIKMYRNFLKTPALILDEEELNCSKFATSNGLIEDLPNFEEQRSSINPWSSEEKEVFLEKLATFGKDFIKISSFLKHKTTADCVEFYYKNHKSEGFKEVRKLLKLRKQRQCLPANTYLVTTGKMSNPEENSVSLDVLGAASLMASRADGSASKQQPKYMENTIYAGSNDWTESYMSHSYLERDSSVEISSNDRESVAVDVLAGIGSTLSSDAMTSCITSSVYPSVSMKHAAADPPLLAEVSQSFDDDAIYSVEGCGESDSTDWTDDEKSLFVRALSIYGKDFAKISTRVRTRSREQCKIFYSKARKCLGLDMIHQDTGSVHVHLGDANGGKSDTDDACAAEMESAICNIPSCSNIDGEMSRTDIKSSSDDFGHAGNDVLFSEAERSCQLDTTKADMEGENNVDLQMSVFHDDNQLGDENNSRGHTLPSKENGDALSGFSDTGGDHDIVDSIPETKKGRSSCLAAPTEIVVQVSTEGETHLPAASFVCREVAGGIPAADLEKEEEDSKQFPVPETGLMSTKSTNLDFAVSSSSTICFSVDSNSNGPARLQENKIDISTQLNIRTNFQHSPQVDHLHCPPRKPHNLSLKQDNAHRGSLKSIFPDTSSICFGSQLGTSPQTSLNFEEHENKRYQHSANKDLFQQCVIRNPAWNQVDRNLNVLRGYPLQVLNQELKRDGDSIFDKPVFLEAYAKKNGASHSNQFFFPDMHGSKSNITTLVHSRPGILCPSGNESLSESQVRLCFQKASSDNEELRTGDVKLFGTVLSHPSSLQKSNSSAHQSNNKPSSTLVSIFSAPNSCNIAKDGGAPALRPGSGGQNSLEEVPIRSFGFWDGNRIQTGFSSLPESTVMLANYQGLSEVPLFSGKDGIASNTGILMDYQKSFMQHFSSDGKRLDTFNEFQKRNVMEMVPVLPQQGKAARLGANVFGGGLLLGNGGVSDPVAALKLHYARAKTYSNEVESWRSDIGRM